MADFVSTEIIKKLTQRGFDVADSISTKTKYSTDTSIFKITPQCVIFPRSSKEIKDLVIWVNTYNQNHPHQRVSLTARSAGTDMTGGPLSASIVLDMTKYFNQIIRIGQNRAVVQPGVYYRDFEKATLKHDLLLPSFPASREICTVGGMAANNSGGEKSLTYGKTERYIEKLKVILSDGHEYTLSYDKNNEIEKTIFHKKSVKLINAHHDTILSAKPDVSKNSAGYALWNTIRPSGDINLLPLFVGAQGTLGIITEITFRLIKPQKYSRLLVVFLKDKHIPVLASLTKTILKYKPESFEVFDNHTLSITLKYLPEFVGLTGANTLLHLLWQFLPEFWLILTSGIPKLVLLVEMTGNSEKETLDRCHGVEQAIADFKVKTRITKDDQETKKYLTIRRESFNLLRHHLRGKRTAPFIDDVIVKPEHLPQFLPKLNKILAEYNITYTLAGHLGDGNFHIIPIVNLADPKTPRIITELMTKIYALVFSFNGSMTAEHNDGMIRSPFLAKMYGPDVYALFRQIKNIFDPQNIFNPNKKIGGSLAENLSHIDRR